jgi:hypothetical protein
MTSLDLDLINTLVNGGVTVILLWLLLTARVIPRVTMLELVKVYSDRLKTIEDRVIVALDRIIDVLNKLTDKIEREHMEMLGIDDSTPGTMEIKKK